jgi:PGF-CTERM protein
VTDDDGNTDTDQVTVDVSGAAAFDTSITSTNSPVTNGSDYVVTVDVENTGNAKATKDVELSVLGPSRVLLTRTVSVTLDSGQTETVSLTASTTDLEAGNYTVSVSAPDSRAEAELEVIDPNESTATSTTAAGTETPGDGETPGFGPVASLLALLVATLVAVRRRD